MASDHMQLPNEPTGTFGEMPARPLLTNLSDRKEHLYTNHFTCSLADHIPLYQYDVTIEEMDTTSDQWTECEGRLRCMMIMQSFMSNNQFDPNVFVWYDEQKHLFSTSYLTPQLRSSYNDQHRLTIKSLSKQCSTSDINDYIHGKTTTYPYDVVRILESLLRRSLQNRIRIVKNKCFFLGNPCIELGNGFEQRQGFIQALNLSSNLLTLNIQSKCATMYSNISLLDFIHQQTGSRRMPSDHDYDNLNQVLKNCLIVTQQSGWKAEYVFDRFDYRRPYEIQLKSGKLLIEYYQEEKNMTLTQINYPCIQVYLRNNSATPCHLPLEVCRIKNWQVYHEPLSEGQESGKHVPTPEERYYEIRNTLHDCNYNSSLLCQAVGFHIDVEEMLEFDARILISPSIRLGLRYRAGVDNGRIFLDGHICVPKAIPKLGITYFGRNYHQNEPDFERFTDKLVDVMERYNLYGHHDEHHVVPMFDEIDRHFRSRSEQNCQFLVCVMDERAANDLAQLKVNIKKCGTITYGIMTQCTIFSEIPTYDEKILENYCENLVRKINFKNGGINTIVDLDIALTNAKSQNDSYMFFGADVLHSTHVTRQHPAIAAIVGSGNPSCSTTAVRVCKQYPKQGKCSIEIIVGMTEMVEQLLDYYQQASQRLPNRVVFYRDGGYDNGQFVKVLEFEVPAIRQAFDKIYGNKTKHPLLTLIVVRKRHNTRFFTYNPNGTLRTTKEKNPSEQTDNMSIGCVIDTTIVHPYQHNFYLNSHDAFQGVNQPSLYHVLLDENNLTADELQSLTYHLCFTDPRSSASEAVPSVVHQAGIAAVNAQDLFDHDEDSSTISSIGRTHPLQNPTPDSLDYEILQVHENLQNKPVFG